jgi:hypothetical protein
MNLIIVYYIAGIALAVAGFIWLGVAWSWYVSFPVPYIWLVWAFTSIFWFVGSWLFLSIPLRQNVKIKHLRERGVRIKSKFFNVETNFQLRVNYQYPYYVQSVGVDPKTGGKVMFRSEDIWFDPTSLIKEGQEIEVVIDPENPNDYLVDLSFLAEKVKEFRQAA